jgi:probable HAF family extracellular repeat protein
METAAPPSPQRPARTVLDGLLDLRPSLGVEPAAAPAEDAVAQGLATVGVHEFTSADYPAAANSLIFDSDGTMALGGFVFNPSDAFHETAFTVAGGVYQILNVPNSTASFATGINKDGLIVGWYQDPADVAHGFATSDGSTFSNVDFPGAKVTQALGVSDAGDIVGSWNDAANAQHGFLSSGGTFTAIDFPEAITTQATGINTQGDIVGPYVDSTGLLHGFVLSGGVFTSIDFPLATGTAALGINDTGDIAGYYSDTAGKTHGFVFADALSAPWTS